MKGFLKKENLFLRIAVGFICGIILGWLFPAFCIKTAIVGTVYLNLIKAMIIPIVICAVFCSIANTSGTKMLKKAGLRTILLYVVMFIASSAVSLAIVYLIRPGKGFSMENLNAASFTKPLADTTVTGFLNKIFPSNIIKAAAEGETLPVILFTMLLAVAAVFAKEKAKPVVDFMNGLSEIMFKVLSYIMQLSPLGVASLMGNTVASYGFGVFGALAKYILCCWICCIAVFFICIALPVCLYTKTGLGKFLKACGKVALVTLSTTSSAATLPTTINVSINDLNAPKELSYFTLPLGCTINMCGGACSFCCLAIFTADIYNINLSLSTVIFMVLVATLINMAAPGIPGGGIILGASFLSVFNMPFEIMGLISGIYRLLDMIFTTINVEGDIAANLIVAKSIGEYGTQPEKQ